MNKQKKDLKMARSQRIQSGFTVVEMCVVIAVISLLAMLVIVSIDSWRSNVAKTEVVSDLNNVKSEMENVRNFSTGYPLTLPTTFVSSEDVQVIYRSGTATTYCIDGISNENSAIKYYVRATNGKSDDPKAGAC